MTTFRRLTAADAPAARALLVTPVAGQSPFQELVADFGSMWDMQAADIVRLAASGDAIVIGAFDGGLDGFDVLLRSDGLTLFGVPGVTSAWESLVTVTDKSLTAAQRLLLFRGLLRFAAGLPADPQGTFVWGDVKVGGRLDTALAGIFPAITQALDGSPLMKGTAAVHRYYASAADVLRLL